MYYDGDMKNEDMENKCCQDCKRVVKKCHHNHYSGGESSAIYGLGVIGAIFYFVSQATGFWPVIVAVLKAIIWPAFVVYKLLGILSI